MEGLPKGYDGGEDEFLLEWTGEAQCGLCGSCVAVKCFLGEIFKSGCGGGM